MAYPSLVLRTTASQPYLKEIFSYKADAYDLDAYEAVGKGFGKRIWQMIENERKYQAERQPK